MMNPPRPLVHPVEMSASQTGGPAAGNPLPHGRMDDLPGMPGTRGGLTLRLNQFAFAFISLCLMTSTDKVDEVTVFRYLIIAGGVQCIWSVSLAIVDLYAILVKRSLKNPKVISVFAVGDAISSTIIFATACAAAALDDRFVSVKRSLPRKPDCGVFCNKVPASIAMAYLSCLVVSSSFILNYWTLASKLSR